MQPPLKFELLGVYAGVDKVAIHYRSVGRRLVTSRSTPSGSRRTAPRPRAILPEVRTSPVAVGTVRD